MPHVISANRLTDGKIVFRAGDGAWTPDLARADRHADAKAADAALATARADVTANLVVEVEANEVREDGGRLVAVAMRDRVRFSGGPTIAGPQTSTRAGATGAAPSENDDVSI